MLVTYDVATDTAEGPKRLRRVAKVCEGYGQRVQKSVFECLVNGSQFEEMKDRLLREIDASEDSLIIYQLREPRDRYLWRFGTKRHFDQRDPLIL